MTKEGLGTFFQKMLFIEAGAYVLAIKNQARICCVGSSSIEALGLILQQVMAAFRVSWLCRDVGEFLETPHRLDTEAKHPEEMSQEYVPSQGMN